MPTSTVRFDHSNCKHATSGSEGKKARAKCRKEHADAAKAGTTKKATKSVSTKSVSKATPKPRAARKTPAKPAAAPVVTDDELTTV